MGWSLLMSACLGGCFLSFASGCRDDAARLSEPIDLGLQQAAAIERFGKADHEKQYLSTHSNGEEHHNWPDPKFQIRELSWGPFPAKHPSGAHWTKYRLTIRFTNGLATSYKREVPPAK
jgi:hypothetical protein